jgi:hypothetical protein
MTAMEVMVKLQEAIDNLEATGGALKPNHCERYLIGFKFNKGKCEYCTRRQRRNWRKSMSEMSLDGRQLWINTQ